jgi:hypothetical protein
MYECPYISVVCIPWSLTGYTATVLVVVPLVYHVSIPCLGVVGWYNIWSRGYVASNRVTSGIGDIQYREVHVYRKAPGSGSDQG